MWVNLNTTKDTLVFKQAMRDSIGAAAGTGVYTFKRI